MIRTLYVGEYATVKLVKKIGKTFAMKIYPIDPREKAKLLSLTKSEYDTVRSLDSDYIVKYHEFNPSAIWKDSKG